MFDPTRPFKKIPTFDPERPFKVIGSMLKDYAKTEYKGLTPDDVEKMISSALQSLPKPKPIEKVIEKQIIKEIKEVERKETREFAEIKTVEDLKKQIEDLRKELEISRKTTALALISRGGSGVIGIPPPEPNPVNYVLTVNSDKKAQWKAASGGGLAAGTFSVSNNTPSYNFDSTGDTVDNLYQIVATLIRKLQGEI